MPRPGDTVYFPLMGWTPKRPIYRAQEGKVVLKTTKQWLANTFGWQPRNIREAVIYEVEYPRKNRSLWDPHTSKSEVYEVYVSKDECQKACRRLTRQERRKRGMKI